MFRTRTPRLLALGATALALATALACTSEDPHAPGGPDFGVTGLATTFLSCTPLPAESETISVGSNGGTFVVGFAKLVVPKGAIAKKTTRTFTMTTPTDDIASVIFTPVDGQGEIRFLTSAKVKLGYKHCTGGDKVQKKVVYTTDADDPALGIPRILETLDGIDDAGSGAVEADVDHFSRYAIAF